MGNEVSSVKVHNLLTAEDLKQLRTQFPGGGSGTPPTSLSWGLWREIMPADLLRGVEKVLTSNAGKPLPGINFSFFSIVFLETPLSVWNFFYLNECQVKRVW